MLSSLSCQFSLKNNVMRDTNVKACKRIAKWTIIEPLLILPTGGYNREQRINVLMADSSFVYVLQCGAPDISMAPEFLKSL